MKTLKLKENIFKTKTYSTTICLLLAVFLFTACKKEEEPEITDIKISECKFFFDYIDALNEDIKFEYKDGNLYIVHENVSASCGASHADISFTIENNTIIITEKVEDTGADCICPIDISYVVGPIERGEYTLIIKGTTIHQTIKFGGVLKSMLLSYPSHVNIKESQIKRFQVIV